MNKTLWAVDGELDEAKFERLCVDLLQRQGFTDIVPIEPQDGGRDAEEVPRRGAAGRVIQLSFNSAKKAIGKQSSAATRGN